MRSPHTATERELERWCILLTAALLIAAPVAGLYTDDLSGILPGLWRILTSPSPLTTDYYVMAGLGATFLNAGLCGGFVLLMERLLGTPFKPGLFVAYTLVIAHGFYGLNPLTLAIGTFGLLIGCKILGSSLKDNLGAALFNGCLGPLFGELLFRYLQGDAFDPSNPGLSLLGLLLAMGFSLLSGLAVPAMLPGIKKMHKGYDLYNAGITIGLLSIFLYGLLYRSFGVAHPASLAAPGPLALPDGRSAQAFVNGFYLLVFGLALITGWLQNGHTFRGYGALVRHNGYEANFVDEFGTPLCLINVGIYGLFILAYMNAMAAMPGAIGFTGPTTGVILAALTFVVLGQEPGDVWPIMLGYLLLGGLHWKITGGTSFLCASQPYINSFAFATGLCPIAGRHGWKWGALAGFVCAALCTQIAPLHGGLMLFNGGFCAGITAMILVPILETIESRKA
ncbi:MAG: DUF1576 domain-containing protein [Clostridia bacterium]|nr:DUF1576 domain-containing protein [Clostridia bacterium]